MNIDDISFLLISLEEGPRGRDRDFMAAAEIEGLVVPAVHHEGVMEAQLRWCIVIFGTQDFSCRETKDEVGFLNGCEKHLSLTGERNNAVFPPSIEKTGGDLRPRKPGPKPSQDGRQTLCPRKFKEKIMVKRGWSLALLAAVLLYFLMQTWNDRMGNTGNDFFQFWATGKGFEVLDVNYKEIYSPETHKLVVNNLIAMARNNKVSERRMIELLWMTKGNIQSVSTPFFYVILSPFSFIQSYETAWKLWSLVCIICTLIAIIIIGRLLKWSWIMIILWEIFIFWLFGPLTLDNGTGNVNQLQLCWVAVIMAFVSTNKNFGDVIAGLFAVMLMFFKPNAFLVPFILGWWLLVTKNWNRLKFFSIGGLLGGGLVISLSAWKFQGVDAWFKWASIISKLKAAATEGNYSNTALLEESLHLSLGYWPMLILTIFTMVAVWKSSLSPRTDNNEKTIWMTSLGFIIYLMTAHLTWGHYYVAVIPLIMAGLNSTEWKKMNKITMIKIVGTIIALLALLATPLFKISSLEIHRWLAFDSTLLLYSIAILVILSPTFKKTAV